MRNYDNTDRKITKRKDKRIMYIFSVAMAWVIGLLIFLALHFVILGD